MVQKYSFNKNDAKYSFMASEKYLCYIFPILQKLIQDPVCLFAPCESQCGHECVHVCVFAQQSLTAVLA